MERDAERLELVKIKKRNRLIDECDKAIELHKKKLALQLFILDNLGDINAIYYDHLNELAVNWTTTEKLMTKDEFDAMVTVFERFESQYFPEGVKLSWKERPKY